ncbi:CpsD/CapB family tyrosine-protein kinase [Paenibacillus sp. CF384]|uniref:CpsD/CapB family tyrosine-protein kinase n=1 Tax=Paenibacillus sp. CF384 TaxID=1884382 RepID=UPI00089AC8C9|nr:CpsD/CapB family tyrosine-protein kinase [Paenibacillus sp. CF384]SDX11904.1 capsular exopolysaccharide family [Paenibacillus sp. CF384]
MSRLMHRSRSLVTENNPKSAVSEIYRSLRTKITFSNRDTALKTVMITSALPGEGKSTTAANVAVAYAQANKRVLLIDADLRTPVQHHIFELNNDRYGLSTALAKHSELDAIIQQTRVENLYVLSAGPEPNGPSELLESPEMTALLEQAKARFDIVIIDTPPVMTVTDALIVANKTDGVVLVVKPGKVKNDTAAKAMAALEYGQATVIGAVLNRAR